VPGSLCIGCAAHSRCREILQKEKENTIMKRLKEAPLAKLAAWLLVGLLLVGVPGAAARPASMQEAPALSPPTGALGPTSTKFTYQGNLQDAGGNPIDGSVDMAFGLYHELAGGTAFWIEAHTAVPVTGGHFAVVLGSVTALDPATLTGDLYLELTVNGETLAPRELFTSVAYAVEASTLVAGATAQGDLWVKGGGRFGTPGEGEGGQIELVEGAGGVRWYVDNYNNTLRWFDSEGAALVTVSSLGNLGVGTGSPSNRLTVSGNADFGATSYAYVGPSQYGAFTFPRGQIMWSNTNPQNQLYLMSNAYQKSGGVFAYRTAAPAGGLAYDGGALHFFADPSGTPNTNLPMNERMTILNGGNVGIGTVNPSAKLHVNGNLMAVGTSTFTRDGWYGLGDHTVFVAENWSTSGRKASIGFHNNNQAEGYIRLDSGANGRMFLFGSDQTDMDGQFTGDLLVSRLASPANTNLTIDAGDGSLNTLTLHDDVYVSGNMSCGAYVEANLQTPDELAVGHIDRFKEGDVLCWGVDRLELCSAANDRLVQAVADKRGRPIVLGAEAIKVLGPVKRGDILVASAVPGYAMVNNDPTPGSVIAQALVDSSADRGLIKAMIRKW
jgi:hypothetical protein